MNFQTVDQANGNNIYIWATLSTWDGIAFTPNQAKYLSCKLKDDNNIEHKCRIYEGKGALPGQEHLEKRMQFSIGSYQGNYQGQPYTGYSGFWNDKAQINQNASQGSPQAPQTAPQSTNYQQPAPQGKKEPDWEAISRGKVRHGVVCAYIQARFKPDIKEVERWVIYIMTGKDPNSIPDPDLEIQNNPNWVGDEPEPPFDDIPF